MAARVELRRFTLERYKCYGRPVEVDLAPLTILVGPNNAGKTALAQGVSLLAGGLAGAEGDAREPLPLTSCGIRHGQSFEDFVTGRAPRGLRLSVTLEDGGDEVWLSAAIANVVAPGHPSERQISDWALRSGQGNIVAERRRFGGAPVYSIDVSEESPDIRAVTWRGLLPERPDTLAEWLAPQAAALKTWAAGVRHLRCPRRLVSSPFPGTGPTPASIGPDGHDAPLLLAANDSLRRSVRDWYRRTFGVGIDLVAQGAYLDLVAGSTNGGPAVRIEQAGRGLSHALPVVVTALSARDAGAGVDIIEHPEAELHPAAHAGIAELLLEHLAGAARPLIIETHSEMILLRARRWVAEGRLPAEHVLVYWIHEESGRGSALEKIRIEEDGRMETWPEGVFIENYEEILAIRRAARNRDEA